MHDLCADTHINTHHSNQMNAKVAAHKDKPLHDYQWIELTKLSVHLLKIIFVSGEILSMERAKMYT